MEPDRVIAAVNAAAADTSAPPVVLIDGRSGSGKTELGVAVAESLGADLIRLDDLYPGWDGLEAGSTRVHTDVLGRGVWRRWDWHTATPAESHEVDRRRPLVIEGSGALSRTNRTLATLGVWVELDEPTRKQRALARDGAMYAPHWEAWAAQEQAFFDRERPDRLADLTIDGAKVRLGEPG